MKSSFFNENHTNPQGSSSFLEWVVLIGILAAAVLLLLPPGNHLSKTQIEQLQSNKQLKGIARLVLAYESEHEGNVPQNLSELVPDDRTDLLSIFCAPNGAQSRKPAGWSTNKATLDKWSDYALPSHPKAGVVAFEESGLWPDGTVAVCFTNLSVERLSVLNFEALLNKNGNTLTQ